MGAITPMNTDYGDEKILFVPVELMAILASE